MSAMNEAAAEPDADVELAVATAAATTADAAPAGTGPGDRERIGHLLGAASALVAGAALAVTSYYSALALLIAVAVVQAVLVLVWVRGTGLPGRIGAIVLGGLAAAGADVVVSVWPHGRLGVILAVLGLAVPAMFVHQLMRGVVRTRVVESLSDIALVIVAVVALSSLLQLRHEFTGDATAGDVVSAVIAAVALGLVVGYLIDVVAPVARFDAEVPRGLLGLVGGIVVGAAVTYLRLHTYLDFGTSRSLFLGGAVAAIAGLLAIGMAFVARSSSMPVDSLSTGLRPVFTAVVPLCLSAPVAYLLALAIRS